MAFNSCIGDTQAEVELDAVVEEERLSNLLSQPLAGGRVLSALGGTDTRMAAAEKEYVNEA